MASSPIRKLQELITTTRENVRRDREARSSYQSLRRELASYGTQRDVDDLLGSIANEEGPEAQQVREVLLDNLR
jgi:hypothetical protein